MRVVVFIKLSDGSIDDAGDVRVYRVPSDWSEEDSSRFIQAHPELWDYAMTRQVELIEEF